MSNEASPRPWQVIKMIGLDEDDVAVYVADAHNSSIALMVAPAENDAENAQLIVDAVNERDRLRDEVTRNDRHQLQEANEAIALLESEHDELCDAVRSLLCRASFLNGFYLGRHASGHTKEELEEAENEFGKTKALIDEIDKLVNHNPERNPKQ